MTSSEIINIIGLNLNIAAFSFWLTFLILNVIDEKIKIFCWLAFHGGMIVFFVYHMIWVLEG